MASVAVALPLPSNVTEFELNEQAGDPLDVGCTEQVSETGLLKALSRLSEMVAVAVWPGFNLPGLSADAEIEKSVPAFAKTDTVFSLFPRASNSKSSTSGALSPVTSAARAMVAWVAVPAEKLTGCRKVPSPFPCRTRTWATPLLELVPTRSSLPSPSQSATALAGSPMLIADWNVPSPSPRSKFG